ncbi:titin-like isoform X2 [Carassius gibelio]|uniref:titin-like isoform X2 n=1 Tax=Carassius gibelio TaxID=101364 RepID=UPI002278B541|nr:titin-like isoform X2 [Carassius gibelio]
MERFKIFLLTVCVLVTSQESTTDPPVPQIQSEWSEAFHGEKVSLKCVIQDSNSWNYTWFKGLNEIVSNDETNIQGNTLTLSVQSGHGGVYECQAELQDRNVTTAKSPPHSLRVHELPKPELSIVSQWKTFYPTEKLTLKCSIKEDSNKWDYEWFRNGALLSQDKDISFSGNTLSISSVNVVHAGQYTCRGKHQTRKPVTTGKTEALQLNVHDTTPKPTITKNQWFEPFYSKERVQLNCNMPGVGWEYHWYKGSNRLTTSPEFTIDSVSVTDTGNYQCKAQRGDFSVDSETLQVRVQDPPKPQIQSEWTEAFHGEKVSLQCVIQDSESWKYTWLRDQNKIVSSDVTNIKGNTLTLSVQSDHGGVYECQAELQDRNVMTGKSPPHSLTVHGPQPTIVLKQDPSYPEIYTGEQVRLNCSIQEKTSKWQYIWEKDSRQVNTDPSNPVYTIQSASLSENGEYTCQVRRGEKTSSKSRKLTVKDPPKPELSIMSQWKTFYTTEKLTLKCSIKEDSDKWDYEWFKNGAPLPSSGSTLSISSVNVVHAGQYTCRGKHQTRKPVTTGKTEALQLHVHDTTPKPTITKNQWFEPFYSKERVQLNCNMPGVGWEYHWYKGSNRLTTSPEFTIDSVSVTDTGDYQCKAQRGDFSVDSETLQVRVQDPPKPQIQSEWTEAFHGEKVSLQCVIQDSESWKYTWFRDQNKMVSKDGTIIMIGNTLTLSVQSDHGGVYECQAELQDRNVMTTKSPAHSLRVHGPQPTIVLKQDPSYPEIYTGEQVRLICSIQEKTSKWQYIWEKDSRQVNTDPSNPVYTIQSASLPQNGEYSCQVRRGEKTSSKSRKLTVKEPPKPELSIMSQWKTFYPTEKLTLKCSIKEDSDKWDYEWFRNGAPLSQDKDISFSGNKLSISSVNVVHAGQYTCRGKHQTRKPVTTGKTEALQLHVHDITPKADISKHQWFEFFYTEERVHLNCTMSGVGWQYQWYKGSSPLIKNAELAFSSVSHTHIGDYHCKAQRGDFSVNSETLQVQVQARPAVSLSLETELGDIMTGDMTLRCNVSDGRQWNYTWFMNGQQLNETSDLLKRKGNEETIKSEFKCKGINTERPLYSALSDGFIANNIIFKRKILLAISLCLVCCIVILIIGCIVLKITRKPEVKETAQDDLFFSMTDSKIQAASPMKEYMDNSPTELEECQEKEELITDRTSAVQEDAVIKDEETPASEANGLISFKGL